MPDEHISLSAPSAELRKGGAVVGITDLVYPIEGDHVTFADVLVRGDLSGELDYNGRTLVVERVDTIIGMEVTVSGPRGPVWKGVECRIAK